MKEEEDFLCPVFPLVYACRHTQIFSVTCAHFILSDTLVFINTNALVYRVEVYKVSSLTTVHDVIIWKIFQELEIIKCLHYTTSVVPQLYFIKMGILMSPNPKCGGMQICICLFVHLCVCTKTLCAQLLLQQSKDFD